MDGDGRLNEKIGSEHIDPTATYELVFETGPFWIERGYNQIMDQVVLRFKMQDPTEITICQSLLVPTVIQFGGQVNVRWV